MVDWDELKRKYERATQGEWLDAGSGSPFWVKLAEDEHGAGWRKNRDNDAALVAALHNALPRILAEREAAQRLRDTVAGLGRCDVPIINEALAEFDKETQNEG